MVGCGGLLALCVGLYVGFNYGWWLGIGLFFALMVLIAYLYHRE